MEPRMVIEMLRVQILEAFDRNVWEWVNLEVVRNPATLSHIYSGSIRRIGEDETHHFMFNVDDHIGQDINWYGMLRDRAIWSLRTAIDHREFVRTELEGTVFEEINPDEVQEIWY